MGKAMTFKTADLPPSNRKHSTPLVLFESFGKCAASGAFDAGNLVGAPAGRLHPHPRSTGELEAAQPSNRATTHPYTCTWPPPTGAPTPVGSPPPIGSPPIGSTQPKGSPLPIESPQHGIDAAHGIPAYSLHANFGTGVATSGRNSTPVRMAMTFAQAMYGTGIVRGAGPPKRGMKDNYASGTRGVGARIT